MEALASGKLVFQIKASGHAAAIKVGLLPVSSQLQLYFYFCANTSTFTATCTNDNAGQKYTVTESRSDKDLPGNVPPCQRSLTCASKYTL